MLGWQNLFCVLRCTQMSKLVSASLTLLMADSLHQDRRVQLKTLNLCLSQNGATFFLVFPVFFMEKKRSEMHSYISMRFIFKGFIRSGFFKTRIEILKSVVKGNLVSSYVSQKDCSYYVFHLFSYKRTQIHVTSAQFYFADYHSNQIISYTTSIKTFPEKRFLHTFEWTCIVVIVWLLCVLLR